MTGLPGKDYSPCGECGRLVRVYPADQALAIWVFPGDMVVCRACADGPHDEGQDEIDAEERAARIAEEE